MRHWIVLMAFVLFSTAGWAAAQTATPVPAPAPTTPVVSTPTPPATTAPPTPPPTGAFATLSPGNQKIARALFAAQPTPSTEAAPAGTTTASTPLTLDEIATMKASGQGWGVIFKDMKAQGLVDTRNLGQLVSRSGRSGVRARLRGLELSEADRRDLVEAVRELRDLPEGSRVRLEGRIDGRRFEADVRNHHGELEVRTRGLQFASREEAQGFVNSLRQDGAARIRVGGTIDGQRFDARARDHNGRVEQRFTVKPPEGARGHGGSQAAAITSGSNRAVVGGGRVEQGGIAATRESGRPGLRGGDGQPKSGHGGSGRH